MGFFEDAVLTVKKTGKNIGDKANEQYGVLKKKVSVTEVKNKIKAAYTDMGRIVYEAKKSQVDCGDKLTPYIALIDDLNRQLATLQAEIDQLKNVVTCPNCQSANPSSAEFCASCGSKLPK